MATTAEEQLGSWEMEFEADSRKVEEKATGLESKLGETDTEELPHMTLHATHRGCAPRSREEVRAGPERRDREREMAALPRTN